MPDPINADALGQIFLNAHTFSKFSEQEVTDDQIGRLYNLLKWGPTSMNCQPGRYVVIRSEAAKKRLASALMSGNLDKTMAAPATIIVANDSRFYENLPTQFTAIPGARDMFENNAAMSESTTFRNGSLQGAYLIIAARALGLDCGPMSGFDNAKVDAEFFPDGRYKANFLVNIGVGDDSEIYQRGPRLSFDQVVELL